MLFFAGTIRAATPEFQTTGVNCEFTIPEDAKPGPSRLRIVFSDAWFAGDFLPSGLHNKGFSMDFGVEITGDNPGRGAGVDIHDQGEADEPEMLGGTVDAINSASQGVSKVEAADGKFNFQNVEMQAAYSLSTSLTRHRSTLSSSHQAFTS